MSEPVQVLCLGGDKHPQPHRLQVTGQDGGRGAGSLFHTGAGGEKRGSKGCPRQREGALPVADAAVMGASWLRGNAFPADGHTSEVVLGLYTCQKRLVYLKPASHTPAFPVLTCCLPTLHCPA